MGRFHLVGPQEAGLRLRRGRGLRDLAITLAAGGLVLLIDRATGGHLESALGDLAVRLSVWYEERRRPVVNCIPGRPKPFAQIEGILLDVPACWEAETKELLGGAVHRFYDPEARAGAVSVIVETAGTSEEIDLLRAEFDRLAATPRAIVDGVTNAGRGDDPSTGRKNRDRVVADSLAERIVGGLPREGSPEGAASSAQGTVAPGAATDAVRERESPNGPRGSLGASAALLTPGRFRRVEVTGTLGATAQPGASDVAAPGGWADRYARRTWSWLLLGDQSAVRVSYVVRANWVDSEVVAEELKRVRAAVGSVRSIR